MQKYYRKKIDDFDQENFEFKALHWDCIDEKENCVIRCFGSTEKGESVFCKIEHFTPFFYLKVPDTWTERTIKSFLFQIPDRLKKGIINEACCLVKKMDFYGYHGKDKKFNFLKIVFKKLKSFSDTRFHFKKNSEIKYNDKKFTLSLYESNLDPLLRFFHVNNIKPSSGLRIDKLSLPTIRESNCSIEFRCGYFNVFPIEKNSQIPFLQASIDIECYSHDGSFPISSKKENVITHLSTSFKINGKKDFLFYCTFSLKSNNFMDPKNENSYHYVFDTEKELLENWCNLIIKTDPDIIYSFNGDQFDWEYIYTRCKMNGVNLNFGKLKNEKCQIDANASFGSSAYGFTRFKRLLIPGRINFDVLIYITREFKEVTYKLDDLSKKYLGRQKNPVTVQDIFDSYKYNDLEKSKLVAKYCENDCVLPQLLVDKFNMVENNIGMSNVCFIPFIWLIFKGQQIKSFSLIVKETTRLDYLVPEKDFHSSEKFTGAIVMDPKIGVYHEPITVLDFASLYPSIIRAHNLCYSSYVMDPKNLTGKEKVETISWEDAIGKFNYTYVQDNQSVLPGLLATLAESRTNAKKLMKMAPKDSFERIVYDKLQNAYKVSMNSLYGFLGAHKLQCKPIGATVTAVGREMIKKTANFIEEKYKYNVIYGDSVADYTPIMFKQYGKIDYLRISTIADTFTRRQGDDKDYAIIPDAYVWSEKGWTKILNLIRHPCGNKKMYSVRTNTGIVDCTEDHSLLDLDGNCVSPKDLKVGDKILHADMPYPKSSAYLNDSINLLVNCMNSIDKKISDEIISIEEINYDEKRFVYDLTTENGHFAAGIGRIIVHNTDSVFYKTEKDMKETMEIGKEIATEASKLFQKPIKLEFEKVYNPLILYKKKRYCGALYSGLTEKPDYIDSKGIVLKRRDNIDFLKNIYSTALDLVMKNKPQEAISFVKEKINHFRKNGIELEKLTISKTLKEGYKNQNIPHLVVAKKRKLRGEIINSNERIPYVFVKVEGEKKNSPQYIKAEDPKYAVENGLKIDYNYYIKTQLKLPLTEILSLITDKKTIDEIFEETEETE